MAYYYDNFTPNFPLNSSLFNQRVGQLDLALQEFMTGVRAFDQLNFGSAGALTLENDTITITGSHYTIDTEAGAASDNLRTIEGGVVGDVLTLHIANSARVVTVKHNDGNIFVPDEIDLLLDDTRKSIRLLFKGTYWLATEVPGEFNGAKQILVPRTVLGSAGASFTITWNTAKQYQHLELILEVRNSGTSPRGVFVHPNADELAAHYYQVDAHIDGAVVFLEGAESLGNVGLAYKGFFVPGATSATAPAGYISPTRMMIYNYLDSSRPRMFHRKDYEQYNTTTGTLEYGWGGGVWQNSADPITSLKVKDHSGTIQSDTAYTLYGVL